MARNQVSFTPPGRPEPPPAPGPVRRRHVLYVPGYDPEARSRSRSLFVRELIRYGRRFGLAERAVTPVEPAPEGVRWHVTAARDAWRTETTFEVLLWDDIVQADFRKPIPLCLPALAGTMADALASGLTARLYRVNWIFASVTIYPAVMVLLLGIGAALLAWAVAALAGAAGVPAILGWLAGIAAAAGFVLTMRPHYGRWYVWHLLHDWLFNWRHGAGSRPDFEARIARFAQRLRAVVEAGNDTDEVLVLGHSSGAGMAVEVVARALAGDPVLGRRGPAVAILTIGTSLPVAAFNRRAGRLPADLRRVVREPDVLWVEYQAPQDWLNAAGFSPLRDLPLDLAPAACVNPVIRSARFAEITSEKTYRTMLRSPFRMHFQFMMANDNPGEYDFLAMMVGPIALADRVRDPAGAAALVQAVGREVEPAA